MSHTAYFPYRAHRNRPYIADFLKLPDKERSWDRLVAMALASTRRSFGERDAIADNPALHQFVHACGLQESWLCTSLAAFFSGGQVVFHVAGALKEAFRLSELGDATPGDLKFPFPDSYIHLGSDTELVFNGGRTRLEGVLLSESHYADGKTISMTLVGTLVEEPGVWGERGMETFTFHFGPKVMEQPILDAAKSILEASARDPDADLSEFDEKDRSEIRESWAIQAEKRRMHRENIPVVLECVRMVANALLYVSQYPGDMEDDYQDGFPPAFREKIERSQGKTKERNLSKARSSGFTIIKRVGRVFEHAMSVEAVAGGDHSPAPHLRRAHWRRQAFGAGLTQRRLIWIRATKVLGGSTREKPYLITNASDLEQSPLT